ncbi:peptidoglycan-binding domain-containing protein [Nannocystis bainbridge]|uniref:Peptidoglycan-binding domain-containing protein n=1 Tax=Nannocystis bainbridge TaxID=2995303 RepID=A0ABT5E771_9BACT|nr:peptidoglycan-binding domain-containing protein [Nannocystis bainbridge]MDC0721702.1 peptidoglycan-binding domain-containing protein [Nannocystis bainbridge]
MPTHKIKPGECISSLAERTWLPLDRIWNDPGNDPLREARRDPNVLAPGDEVSLPEPGPRTFEVGVDGAHCFRVKRPRAMFRLRLQRNGNPLASEPYALTMGGLTLEGTADDEGRLEVALPADVTWATLVLPERGEKYEFKVGHLEPADHWRGAAQRLRSLGLYGAEPSTPDDGFQRALRRFQALRGLEVTGALDGPTIAALQEAHGC